MVSKKANSTVKVTAAKAEEKAAVKEAVEAKAVKAERKAEEKAAKTPVAKPEEKADKKETEAAKAIETKKDSTMKLETKAAVLVDTPEVQTEETAAKKTAAKKSTAKKAELKTEMFLQFAGKEYTEKEILQKVKEIWTKNLKRKVGEMKDVKIYLKPEE